MSAADPRLANPGSRSHSPYHARLLSFAAYPSARQFRGPCKPIVGRSLPHNPQAPVTTREVLW